MAIVKMKRLRLIAAEGDRQALLARLLHIGCVELSEPKAQLEDPEWSRLLRRAESLLSTHQQSLEQVTAALKTLDRYAPAKGGLFRTRKAIREEDLLCAKSLEQALDNAGHINGLRDQIEDLLGRESRLAAQRAALKPWAALDVDLAVQDSAYVSYAFCACPAGADPEALKAALREAAPTARVELASTDSEQHYFLWFCHKSETEAAWTALRPFGVSLSGIRGVEGTAIDNIVAIDRQAEELERQRRDLEGQIAALADCRLSLEISTDHLRQEMAKETSAQRGLSDGSVIFFTGWITQEGEKALARAVEDLACAWECEAPSPEEYHEVPVQLSDHPVTRPMNMITEMYGLPAYGSIDPNPLIWPFFLFFFGFMFADLGYGLLMVVFALVVKKLARPKGGTGYLIDLVFQCGIATSIIGFFTGGFFADLIATVCGLLGVAVPVIPFLTGSAENGGIPPLLDVMNDPMTVLVFSLVIGCVQILTGMGIKAYLLVRAGKWKDALMDIGSWWLLFAGIAVGAVSMLNGAGFWWVAIAGALALVLTQGRSAPTILGKVVGGVSSLYDITGYFGDILSYSRLMVMMLAGSVIGQIFNLLGAMPGTLLVFIPVFLIGHAFNMGLNVIGTYVHTSRLQYLEYFKQFYEEGGHAFRPLTFQTNYVDVIKEEE